MKFRTTRPASWQVLHRLERDDRARSASTLRDVRRAARGPPPPPTLSRAALASSSTSAAASVAGRDRSGVWRFREIVLPSRRTRS